jgi:hypothetical protein
MSYVPNGECGMRDRAALDGDDYARKVVSIEFSGDVMNLRDAYDLMVGLWETLKQPEDSQEPCAAPEVIDDPKCGEPHMSRKIRIQVSVYERRES